MELRAKAAATAAVTRVSTIALLIALAALGIFSAGASATTIYYHPFLGKFGPKGPSKTTRFVHPLSLAVDQGSHQVYVYDRTKEVAEPEFGTLYRFTASGEPDPYSAGPGAGTNAINVEEPVSHSETSAGWVAVAPPGSPGGTAGDVYFIHAGQVEVFASTGASLGVIDGSGNPNPGSTVARTVTTDAAGNLYIGYQGHFDKYVASANPPKNSDFDSEVPDPGVGRITDSSNGDFYVPEERGYFASPSFHWERAISQYDAADNLISRFGSKFPNDLDIDSGTGKVYGTYGTYEAAERAVRIYGDGEAVQSPSAVIDPATEVHFESAHLSGTVNPGAAGPLQETTYYFVCNPECPGLENGKVLEEERQTLPGDGADHAVSVSLAGLEAETHYEVTLVARNANFTQALPAAESRATASFDTPAKPATEAPAATIDPVTQFGAVSAHLTGTVDPKGSGELQATTYRFEYSSDGEHWTSAGDQGPIEGGAQAVSAELEGLEPNTAYEVRLHAENVGGAATSAPPNPSFTTEAVAPEVEMTGATQVLTSTAQLNGRVDPRNLPTTFWFEWGSADCASNPCASVPAGQNGDAGSGHELGWVHAQVEGLEPGRTYSYRLVAKNAAGEAVSASASFTTEAPQGVCPNAALRAGESAALPDCRAYEMVSPPDKNGGNVATIEAHNRVASDGNAVSFESLAAFAGTPGAPYDGVEYMAVRGPEGWLTHSISPYQAPPPTVGAPYVTLGSDYTGRFSPDSETGIYLAQSPIPGVTTANVAEKPNLYLATGLRKGTPKFQLLSDSETSQGPLEEPASYIDYAGASAGFQKIVFKSKDNLTALASGEALKVYEWEGGDLRLAGILPDSACGSPPCVAPESVPGASADLAGYNKYSAFYLAHTDTANVVSADGSKVFFTVPRPFHFGEQAHGTWDSVGSIYARLDGQSTVQVDASEASAPDPELPSSQFGAATPDGETVYFTSANKLLDSDKDGRTSLYRYDFAKPLGHRLTLIPLPGDFAPLDVQGVSKSGDIAYVTGESKDSFDMFVVRGDKAGIAAELASGAPASFVAFGRYLGDVAGENSDFQSFRMTPDGRYASFVLPGNVVGYDPHNIECKIEAECSEVYLFSFDSGELTCASCDFGNPATGDAYYGGGTATARDAVENTGLLGNNDINQSAPLTVDGRYLFFNTPDALVPKDSNGQLDVYRYDVEKREVQLISSGQCNCKTRFAGASPNGNDIFFTTAQRLVGADQDGLVDLYDARVGGGLAAQNAVPSAECQGDACQGVPASPPETTPASQGFVGPGSPPPARAGRKCRHRKRCGHHRARHRHARHANKKGGSK